MTDLPDVHTMSVTAARQARQENGHEHPYVLHLAGRDEVLSIIFAVPDPTWPLAVAANLGPLLRVDSITLVAEAYTVASEDPDDLPEAGDVQAAFERGDPAAEECLQVATVWRDGRSLGSTLPYARVGRYLHWGERFDGDLLLGGIVSDALREAIAAPPPLNFGGTEREQFEAAGKWVVEAGGCVAAVANRTDLAQAYADQTHREN